MNQTPSSIHPVSRGSTKLVSWALRQLSANAVYHPAGTPVLNLLITLDKL
jgi:hypothetical protein